MPSEELLQEAVTQHITPGALPANPTSPVTVNSSTPPHLSSPRAMSPEDAPTTSPLAGEEGPIPFNQNEPQSPSRTSSPPTTTTSFNLTCMTCHTHFTSAEHYARHHCVSSGQQTQDSNESTGDVEQFDGKIVYNPDGSAYIIDSEMSEDETASLDLPRLEGSIEDSQRHPLPASVAPAIPPIANAIYVTKNSRALYSALYGQTMTSLLQEPKVPEVPIVHNYRVFNVGDKDSETERTQSDNNDKKLPQVEQTQVPIKPILMCFICKLSFGYVKSFIAHAMGDHSIVLMDQEKDVLSAKNASAIIQNAGREKEPRVSFLEPVSAPEPASKAELATLLPQRLSSGPSPSGQSSPQKSPSQTETSSTGFSSPVQVKREEENQPENSCGAREEQGTISVKPEFSEVFDAIRQRQLQQQQLTHSLQTNHFRDDAFSAPQSVRTPDASRKSPISSLANGRASLSPVTTVSPNNFASPLQSSLTQLTGTVIGACPEHMSGRPQGVSCEKCDMILQQSRQIGGQMAFMHSRNSCKTLKCPKCNWHYKYQETLEIHMKEKHPESESNCIYCITSQPHPRLARGETYTCGYKPYRCEVCNYSTTTKGNLSIHMQSDKHLNNMQELQNGGLPPMDGPGSLSSVQQTSPSASVYSAPKTPTPSTTPAGGSSPGSHQKSKPMWRCDVCNYETNVARNLRIHMTSEKHTHNMMVLQQNVKQMQQYNALQGATPSPGQMDPITLLQYAQNPAAAAAMMAGMGVGGMEKQGPPEAALADMAYNQALLIQMMAGNQVGNNPSLAGPPGHSNSDHIGPHFDLGLNPESLEPPPEPVPANPKHSFTCCVCSVFHTDSLEQLNIHLQMDRSKLNENEVLILVSGNYICKLCTYKTNLKANFQLHCKTDKHLQKLQHVNHILEGGPRNEWKLKFLANTNPMHMRCNLCEYYTNSVHKLQLHASHQRHEVLSLLFRHLCTSEATITEEKRLYKCMLCSFSTKAKLQLLHHIRSMRHLQMEQLYQIQRHSEGKTGAQQDIGDIFRVEESDDDSRSTSDSQNADSKEEVRSPEAVHACPFCSFTSEAENSLQAHIDAEHNNDKKDSLSCPLCEESCSSKETLEKHMISAHSVNPDGLQRLLLLVQLSSAAKKGEAEEEADTEKDGPKSSGKRPLADPTDERPSKVHVGDGSVAQSKEKIEETSGMGADTERSRRDEDMVEAGSRSTSDDKERELESSHFNPSSSTPAPRATPTPSTSTALPQTPTSTSSVSVTDPPTTSPGAGMNMSNMAEMAAAISALTNAQMHPMQMHPMMMASLGLAGLPMHLNPLAAMNLQPPLLPMMHHPILDPSAIPGMTGPNMPGAPSTSSASAMPDPSTYMKQQQQQLFQHQHQQQHQAAAAAAAVAAAQQKRARTRITDEQLKILRGHFDINNSPSEEQINEMAKQSGLPPKVIKHWFRNTLFKERQRCKDSPYNFSIPPSTSLNIEEYEKTGEAKVMQLNPDEAKELVPMSKSNEEQENAHERSSESPKPKVPSLSGDTKVQEKNGESGVSPSASDINNLNNNSISVNNNISDTCDDEQAQRPSSVSLTANSLSPPLPQPISYSQASMNQLVSSASSSPLANMGASLPSPFSSLGTTQQQLSLQSLISSQLDGNPLMKLPHSQTTVPSTGLIPPSSGISPSTSQMSGFPSTPPTPTSVSSVNSGKRANRTRFTDYQIKVLQEFFENNAYPKDDDLEYLSKLLNLSPRVIVVWFQNARQKARKVYENQPPIDPTEENTGRFTRTPGLNYQCKKCLLVFQRYYELIRHQKTHCFKEEDAKRSAQAQAAAAQAAALYADDNSNNSSITESSQHSRDIDTMKNPENSFPCEKCSMTFNRFELWREHQIVHLMNPTLFLNKGNDSPFPPLHQSIVPQHSPQPSPQQTLQSFSQRNLPDLSHNSPQPLPSPHLGSLSLAPQTSPIMMPSPPMKRKTEESEDEKEANGDMQRDKRLRTTILPEQLDYLYQKYQMEANPSRKMLETIAQEVGLKKRVVQVWFQNTRARERKGQFRAHAQVINKKCPFCPAIFKVKSALESHLSTKHADQYSKGDINIDALPDVEDAGVGNYGLSPSASSSQVSHVMSSSLFSSPDVPEDSIAKYHEEAIKRYLKDVSLTSEGIGGFKREGETPLDLSKPFELAKPLGFDPSHLNDHTSDRLDYWSDEDGCQLEISEHEDGELCNNSFESNPTSPASSTTGSTKLSNHASKRFRTQMSGVQVKIMKVIFQDYKTPTMGECEMLGREIGLAKRVVQVWFQNARAKEKKAKLALQKVLGTEPEPPKPPEECRFCNFTYSHKYSIQDHIFTREHIENLRKFLEKLKEESDNSRSMTPSAMNEEPRSATLAQQIQIAQLMALGSQSNNSVDEKKSSNEEDLNRLHLLRQVYQQMGLGSLQGTPHPLLLQQAMMAGAGE